MFDLDHAISEWRRELAAQGLTAPDLLDELEAHLRDDIDQHEHAGSDPECAFKLATQKIGPAIELKREFSKVAVPRATQTKQAVLAFAGIPNNYASMNTSNLEPRWATYLKATIFLAPAGLLWLLSVFFVVPKVQQICAQAGGQPLPGFLRAMLGLTHNGLFVCAGVIAVLALLEWRSTKWPRYRRATVGLGAFLFNSMALLSIFALVIVTLLNAPALFRHG